MVTLVYEYTEKWRLLLTYYFLGIRSFRQWYYTRYPSYIGKSNDRENTKTSIWVLLMSQGWQHNTASLNKRQTYIILDEKYKGSIWPKPSTPPRVKEILDYSIILTQIIVIYKAKMYPANPSQPWAALAASMAPFVVFAQTHTGAVNAVIAAIRCCQGTTRTSAAAVFSEVRREARAFSSTRGPIVTTGNNESGGGGGGGASYIITVRGYSHLAITPQTFDQSSHRFSGRRFHRSL